ncbi:uncharacterized protein LOC100193912 [Zea mays]|uniref:Uncharacterized protein n=2 Tax=Zea mays TaxID=4577 RepID=A0A1D6ICU8_MAIZE|nr:uncharacterized protein LOC100193912 [Zea mays]ONM57665.1 hypothetical protein ZEAMMB73_Zm00001d021610 [Zea mays]|eukprot:XP_008650931.1 uncharacterized protein LOC100193912 isoform X2 [Zea mays]
MEGLFLIDVSTEDDLLFNLVSPAPRRPDPLHAESLVGAEATSSGVSPSAVVRATDPDCVMEEREDPERTESPEQRKAKKGVNLRKSLAWDSEFFTSEGVLDTEELAIVNSTYRKAQGSRLPGIIEETRRSGESTTSTLESETWAMESLETELFDNVRASIQRSLGKPDKLSGRPVAASNPPKATANAPRVAARKGVDRMPQSKMRAPVSTSQGAVSRQRPQVTINEPVAARDNLTGAAEAKISSKPPRALPRVAMMRSSTNTTVTSRASDKRNSTGGAVNRQAVGKTASTSAVLRSGRGTNSSSILKSGFFTSAATSSHCMLMDTKPEAKTKSATLSIKNRPAQRVPVRPSSKSDISKTIPSRSSGNRIPAKGHADRASPSISPSSSMDSMSSVISGASTASTVGKMSHTSDNLNALSPSLRKSNDCHPNPKFRPPIVTEGHSSGTAASRDNLKATAEITNQGKGLKPSGLRRPTPKIGYFDAENYIDQNIGAQVQPQLSNIQCLPTQNMNLNAAPSTYGQQESKLTAAPHEESCVSKSKLMTPLSLMVEVEPFKVAELACTNLTDPVVVRPESVQPQSMEIQCLLPATPNPQPTFHQQVLKPIAAPLEAVQMEVEAFKVDKPEACIHLSSPVVVKPENKSIDQNAGALLQLQLVAEPESCTRKSKTVVAADYSKENIPALNQNIQANGDANSLVELLTQKLSSISLGEAAPNVAPRSCWE